MNFKRCLYIVEGSCEKQLINALKAEPRLLVPGKIMVLNVFTEELPRRTVNMIQPGTTVRTFFRAGQVQPGAILPAGHERSF